MVVSCKAKEEVPYLAKASWRTHMSILQEQTLLK